MIVDWQWDVEPEEFAPIMERAAQAALETEGILIRCGVFIRVTDDQ